MAQDMPKMAQDTPKMAQDTPEKGKTSSEHRFWNAFPPFFEHLPSENAIFDVQHKPVLAWEREARSRKKVPKQVQDAPHGPKVAQDEAKMAHHTRVEAK